MLIVLENVEVPLIKVIQHLIHQVIIPIRHLNDLLYPFFFLLLLVGIRLIVLPMNLLQKVV